MLTDDPGNLPKRMAEAIVSHKWTDFPRSAHNQHNYYAECAVCQRDVPRITEIALSVLLEDPGDLPDRMSDAIDNAIISGDDYNSVKAATAAMSVRDELVAHLSARAAKAEARVGHAEAGAQLSSERLAKVQQELAEVKRVTEPPAGDEEMPTDPAELREMWEFINRQARWQWHMAHKYGNEVERLCERYGIALQRSLDEGSRASKAKAERDRLRLAWQSARDRAKAYGDSMTRLSAQWGTSERELAEARAVWCEWRERLGGSFPRAMVQEMTAALDTETITTPARETA